MIRVQPVNATFRFLVNRIESEIARDYTNRHDQNGNGAIERSEFQGNREVFDEFDGDQNSRLELSEVKRYIDLLGQRQRASDSESSTQTSQSGNEQSFGISGHARLTQSIRDHFSEEIGNLDDNGNEFLDQDEWGGTPEEFSAMDTDHDNLVTAREWAEGFVESNTGIQMAIKAYRFSQGIFGNSGGIIQMSV